VLTLEPVIGVVIGILAGVESVPQTLTFIGGPISVIGCVCAIYGGYQREQREQQQQRSSTINSDANDTAMEAVEGLAQLSDTDSDDVSDDEPEIELQPIQLDSTTDRTVSHINSNGEHTNEDQDADVKPKEQVLVSAELAEAPLETSAEIG